MKKIFFSIIFIFSLLRSYAQPGKDGTLTVTTSTLIVNRYSPLSASISIGDNTLSIANTSTVSLCQGDLIMVYQAQGAFLNFTNSSNYGDITAYNSAGLYEFKYVQSASGNVITTQTTFTNSYALSGRPQVIKVPQYSTLTINPGSSIIPKPWKDTTIALVPSRFGGLVVIHAANIINNGAIKADGSGFRGGAITTNSFAPFGPTWYVTSLITDGGEKGEGIFGYQTDYDLNGGRFARGAPANGGGGGTAHNAGGGGGSNGFNGNTWTGAGVMTVDINNLLAAWSLDPEYIANANSLANSSGGGRGGYTFASLNGNANINAPGSVPWGVDYRRDMGGFGGRPLNNIDAETRIYFGGGGGAASYNDAATSPASNGAGIVYLVATAGISGTGTISANGNTAGNTVGTNADGAPGAGAGGSIVIKTLAIAGTQSVLANGGNGGSQGLLSVPVNTAESEGPGGGGGGGFIAISALGVIPVVNGGNNGSSLSVGVTEMPFNGATKGATGQTGTVTSSFITFAQTNTLISNSPVCSGAAINFTNSAASTYYWSGPNSFTSSVQNPVITNATILMSGTYSVNMTFTGNCFSFISQSIAVVVNPAPTMNPISFLVCPGTNSIITMSGNAATYTWNPGPLFGSSVIVNLLATTVYTITGTSASNCTTSATSTLFVAPAVAATTTASPSQSACVGSSINVIVIPSGGTPAYTLTWTAGPLVTVYSVTRPAGSYIYTVTVQDVNRCTVVKTISVSFIAPPVLSVSSISICPGTAGTLSASGATSYTWNPGSFAVNPFVSSPVINSNYAVTGSAQGCTASATASITLKPVPVVSFVTASITCASLGSATVTASGGALGPYSYSWTPTGQTTSVAINLYPGIYTLSVFDAGSGCTSVSTTTFSPLIPFTGTVSATNSLVCNGLNTGTASIILAGGSGKQSYSWSNLTGAETSSVAANLSAGIHTVSITDSVTFCNLTQNFQIIQPLPLATNITKSASLACVGSTVVLSATGSGGTPGYTFTWTSGPANYLYVPTQTVSGTYVYTVNLRDANNCLDSANIALTFADYPVLKVNDVTICNGAVATLSVSGAQAYSWFPGGFTGNVINVSVSAGTSYTVSGNTSGCISSTTASVFVNAVPVPIIVSSNNICEGASISFNTANNGNYQWLGPNGFNSTSQNPVISSAILNNAGAYSLAVTDINGCSASTSTVITVYANPVISATGASVCIGEPAILTAWGGQSYSWSGPNNYTSNQANAFIPAVNNNSSGSYMVFVTGLNSCTSSTVVQVAGYNFPLPTPSISATSKICIYSKINLQGSGGGSYLWNGPAGFISTDQNLDFTAGSLNMSGIYTLTVKNQSNCAASATVLITVYALPNATVTSRRDKTCVPLCTDFSFVQANNIAPIVKTNFIVENLFASDTAFSYCIQAGGNRLVTLFFTDTNGCVNSSTLNLTVYPQPIADFEYYPQNPVENIDEVIFTNTSSGETLSKWNWFFTENGGYTSQLSNTTFMFEKSGAYPVAMIVINSWGCSDTIIKPIVVEEEFSLYVPNSFTPNNDGKNDFFQPKGLDVVTYHLQIFDRWGEKLFSSNDFLKGWDGSFKGRACQNDVYLWKIDVTNSTGKTKNLAGYVSVME